MLPLGDTCFLSFIGLVELATSKALLFKGGFGRIVDITHGCISIRQFKPDQQLREMKDYSSATLWGGICFLGQYLMLAYTVLPLKINIAICGYYNLLISLAPQG